MSICKDCEYFDASRCNCDHPDGEELIMPTSDACELFEESSTEIFVAALRAAPIDMEWGKEYSWTCGCGGTINGIRSTYNGHLWAACEKCGMQIIQ